MKQVLITLLLFQSINAMEPTSGGIFDEDTAVAIGVIGSSCCLIATVANICLCRYMRRMRILQARRNMMSDEQRDIENQEALRPYSPRLRRAGRIQEEH